MANKWMARQNLALPFLLFCLAALVGLLTWLSPERPSSEPIANRSIYNSSPTGYRAWHLAAKKAGIPMLSWEKPFDELGKLPAPATMLIVAPYTVAQNDVIFGQQDAAALLAWVAKGNTLVLLDDFRRFGSQSVAYALSLKAEHDLGKDKDNPARNPKPYAIALTGTAKPLGSYIRENIISRSDLHFGPLQSQDFPAKVLAKNGKDQPMLLRIEYGQGSLLLGTLVDLGDNAYLHGQPNDNYQFLSNLLLHEKKPIFINEFVHGYAESRDAFSYYQQKTPLGAIFAQLALGFLFMLWLSFVRWTPKPEERPESAQSRQSYGLNHYIQSLASIGQRNQAAALALRPQVNRIETLLRQRFRVALDEDSRLRHLLGSVFADYSNEREIGDFGADDWLNALRKAQAAIETQGRLPNRELLKLSQQLTLIEERLQHHGTRSPANRR